MQEIDINTLAAVTGGASKSSAVSQSLTAIQSSISDLSKNNTNNSSNSLLLPVMMLALGNRRQQPSVVSTPGATVVTG
jgi:hypothetical protein